MTLKATAWKLSQNWDQNFDPSIARLNTEPKAAKQTSQSQQIWAEDAKINMQGLARRKKGTMK